MKDRNPISRPDAPASATANPVSVDARPTVLFIANTDWYLFNFRRELIDEVARRGYQPILVCPNGAWAKRLRDEGLQVETLGATTWPLSPWVVAKRLLQTIRVARRHRPCVVHAFTLESILVGSIAARFTDTARVIAAFTGLGHLFTTQNPRAKILRALLCPIYAMFLNRSGTAVVFQNAADRDEAIALGIVDAARCHVIRGSGVNVNTFDPEVTNHSRSDGPPRVLFIGRLLREKGILEYLGATARAWSQGAKFESLIAGDIYPGNPSSLSKTDIERFSASGHRYLGHVEDVRTLLSEIDLVVLPTYREGTPRSLIEAAAMCRVIITSDVPGCRGLVEDGDNGALVSPRDTDGLTDALLRTLALDAPKLAAMGARGRQRVIDSFSAAAVNDATLALYGPHPEPETRR